MRKEGSVSDLLRYLALNVYCFDCPNPAEILGLPANELHKKKSTPTTTALQRFASRVEIVLGERSG